MKVNPSARSSRTAKAWAVTPLCAFNKTVLLTLVPIVCAAGMAFGQTEFVKKEPVKIGYSVFDLQQPYWQAYTKGSRMRAKRPDINASFRTRRATNRLTCRGALI